ADAEAACLSCWSLRAPLHPRELPRDAEGLAHPRWRWGARHRNAPYRFSIEGHFSRRRPNAQRYVSGYTFRMIQGHEGRRERSKQAVLDATRELLTEGDVRSLTVEAVAARSGVAKTTIYRRWRDKWHLALDAVMIDLLPRFAEPVDVGDTRRELVTFV